LKEEKKMQTFKKEFIEAAKLFVNKGSAGFRPHQ